MATLSYDYLSQYSPGLYKPAFDNTGTLASNRVTGEKHVISAANNKDFHFVVPLFAPFFADETLSVGHTSAAGVYTQLRLGIDYLPAHQFIGASRACAKPIYGSISLLNTKLAGTISLTYQTLGGSWTLDISELTTILTDVIINPRALSWEQVIDKPVLFPVIDHEWNLDDLVGAKEIVNEIRGVADAIAQASMLPVETVETAHVLDHNNPHNVTKEQVGLGNVENYRVATLAEAQQGTSTTTYMTPGLTAAAIDKKITGGVSAGGATIKKSRSFYQSQI